MMDSIIIEEIELGAKEKTSEVNAMGAGLGCMGLGAGCGGLGLACAGIGLVCVGGGVLCGVAC